MDELKFDVKLLKVLQDKDLAVEALARKLEGYGTCTRFLLERINSNIVEIQISDAGSNFDYYEVHIDKLVRRLNLLEDNVKQLVNSDKHEVHQVQTYSTTYRE